MLHLAVTTCRWHVQQGIQASWTGELLGQLARDYRLVGLRTLTINSLYTSCEQNKAIW
jgi:hypothetical protein